MENVDLLAGDIGERVAVKVHSTSEGSGSPTNHISGKTSVEIHEFLEVPIPLHL
jgi:hypothetical protein